MFNYTARLSRSVGYWFYKKAVSTQLATEARVVRGQLILHASYTLVLPSSLHVPRSACLLVHFLKPALPPIVFGHCGDEMHGRMRTVLKNATRSRLQDGTVHVCVVCATDFRILSSIEKLNHGSERTLHIDVWRALRTGQHAENYTWRAHAGSKETAKALRREIRLVTAGSTKKAFDEGGGEEKPPPQEAVTADERTAYQPFSWERFDERRRNLVMKKATAILESRRDDHGNASAAHPQAGGLGKVQDTDRATMAFEGPLSIAHG